VFRKREPLRPRKGPKITGFVERRNWFFEYFSASGCEFFVGCFLTLSQASLIWWVTKRSVCVCVFFFLSMHVYVVVSMRAVRPSRQWTPLLPTLPPLFLAVDTGKSIIFICQSRETFFEREKNIVCPFGFLRWSPSFFLQSSSKLWTIKIGSELCSWSVAPSFLEVPVR